MPTSELSKFIEDELRSRGHAVDNEIQPEGASHAYEDEERVPLVMDSSSGAMPGLLLGPSDHSTLMGALRVEARVKEQIQQKSLHRSARIVCIGGGCAIIFSLFLLLVLMARNGRQGSAIDRRRESTEPFEPSFDPPPPAPEFEFKRSGGGRLRPYDTDSPPPQARGDGQIQDSTPGNDEGRRHATDWSTKSPSSSGSGSEEDAPRR